MKLWQRSITAAVLGLALLMASGHVRAQGANVELATAAEKQSATADYRAGMKALEEKKTEAALELFRKSYATVASPNSGLMIARSLVELGRLSEGYQQLEQVTELANALARGNPKYKTTADAAQKELEDLKPKVARLTVTVPVAVAVNDVGVPAERWGKALALPPGATTVRLRIGDQNSEQRVTLSPGSEQSIALSLPPPQAAAPVAAAPPPETASTTGRTLGYVALGVGAVGLGVSTAFLLLNQGKLDDIKDNCRGTECPGIADDVDASRSGETLALVGLGVGLVGVGVGAYLILSSSSSEPKQASAKTTLRVGLDNVRLAAEF
jgi:hypothetical protein